VNLLARNFETDDVMIYFFKRGELINYVTLEDLIERRSSLKRTASHYRWGRFRGLDEDGNYVVETVERRTLVSDVATGRPIWSPGSAGTLPDVTGRGGATD
jgi:hypothetical protein